MRTGGLGTPRAPGLLTGLALCSEPPQGPRREDSGFSSMMLRENAFPHLRVLPSRQPPRPHLMCPRPQDGAILPSLRTLGARVRCAPLSCLPLTTRVAPRAWGSVHPAPRAPTPGGLALLSLWGCLGCWGLGAAAMGLAHLPALGVDPPGARLPGALCSRSASVDAQGGLWQLLQGVCLWLWRWVGAGGAQAPLSAGQNGPLG